MGFFFFRAARRRSRMRSTRQRASVAGFVARCNMPTEVDSLVLGASWSDGSTMRSHPGISVARFVARCNRGLMAHLRRPPRGQLLADVSVAGSVARCNRRWRSGAPSWWGLLQFLLRRATSLGAVTSAWCRRPESDLAFSVARSVAYVAQTPKRQKHKQQTRRWPGLFVAVFVAFVARRESTPGALLRALCQHLVGGSALSVEQP